MMNSNLKRRLKNLNKLNIGRYCESEVMNLKSAPYEVQLMF